MRLSACLGIAVVLLLVAAGFPWRGVSGIYGSGLLWVLGLAAAVLSTYACALLLMDRRWIKAALHVAIPVLMVGALLDETGGERAEFGIFVGTDYQTDEIYDMESRRTTPVDFRFAIEDFSVEYYPGQYALLDSSPQRLKTLETAPLKNGEVFFPRHKVRLKQASLPTRVERPTVPAGMPADKAVLLLPPKEKRYTARMRIWQGERSTIENLEINAPVDVGPWRFYLLSHGEQKDKPFVYLLAKRAPGGPFFKAAFIWLSVAVFLWSFAPRKKTLEARP